MTASYRYDVECLHLLVSPAHAYFGRVHGAAVTVFAVGAPEGTAAEQGTAPSELP